MEYINAKEASVKWGISERRVRYLCSEGKVSGAKSIGKQWIIPADTARPVDGRTKNARAQKDEEPYHFPLLIYTRHYASQAELSDSEKLLLQAQELHLQGEYVESVSLCRKLLAEEPTTAVTVGAYFTIAFNAMLIGLPMEYQEAAAKMETLCRAEKLHQMDYLLLLLMIRFHTDWNFKPLARLDSRLLSPDALLTHQYLLLTASLVSGEEETETAVTFFSVTCRRAELEGVLPIAIQMHCILSVLYRRLERTEDRQVHMDCACRIAVKNGWVPAVAKYYTMDAVAFDQTLDRYGKKYALWLKEKTDKNLMSWQQSWKTQHDLNIPLMKTEEEEMIALLYFGYSNRVIAELKGITMSRVNQLMRKLCEKYGCESKKELVQYAEKQYHSFIAPKKITE